MNFALVPTAAGVRTAYDALGRVTQSQQNSELGLLTTSTAYLSGARQQVTDPKGNVTTTSYQVFDQPSADAPIKLQAPAGITQTIARDIYGKPLSITQSGLYGTGTDSVTKTWLYDTNQRLCRTWEPESGDTVVAYDAANNVRFTASGLAISGGVCGREQVQASAMVTRTHDAMNRLLTVLPPAGTQSTQYHYTALGQPDSIVSGISTWSGTYNHRGMLTGESLQLVGQSAWGIGYAHDAYGNVSVLHYPNGENISYAPDALGRPTQVSGYITSIGYFPNGQMAQATFANGGDYVTEQNARQMLSNFSYGTGGTLQLSEDLSYDPNGNITQITDLAGGLRSRSLGYDALDRLTSASAPSLWGTQAYTYDALNNIRTRVDNGQTATYHYDPTHRLASISGAGAESFAYDNRGNVIGRHGTTLGFDHLNQLTQVAGYASYAYDAAGRRVSKTPTGGTPSYYFYNRDGLMLYRRDSGTAMDTNFIYLGRKLVGRSVTAGGVRTPAFLYTDPQGTLLAVANSTGGLNASSDFLPYGAQAMGYPSNGGPGYTGHINDADTGLVYMQARYYDPANGKFLSVDPVGPTPGNVYSFNRYAYASNNPVMNIDPDGRQSVGEMIDSNAQAAANAGDNVATFGWAFAGAAWGTLGAEELSQTVDKGSAAGAGNIAMAAVGIATLGKGGSAVKGVEKAATITRSSLNRVKALVRGLSNAEAKAKPIGQVKVGKLERIVEKAGGALRNDGAKGVKGSSAGTPHVQTEGLGGKTDSRHIWTEPNVKLKDE